MGFQALVSENPYAEAKKTSLVAPPFKASDADIRRFVKENSATLQASKLLGPKKFKRVDVLADRLLKDIKKVLTSHEDAGYLALRKHKDRIILQVLAQKALVQDNTLGCYRYVGASGKRPPAPQQDAPLVQPPAQQAAPPQDEDEENEENEEEQADEENEQEDEQEDEENEEEQADENARPNIVLSQQQLGGGQGFNNGGIRLARVNGQAAAVKDASAEEARLLQKAAHDNIVRMIAYDPISSKLAMEPMLCSVQSLEDECAANEPLLRGILRQSLGGLLHMHRNGVAHGDLMMENVLLDETHAKIADFGVAKAASVNDAEQKGKEHPFYKDLKQFRDGLVSANPRYDQESEDEPEYAQADPKRPTFDSFVVYLDGLLEAGTYDKKCILRLMNHPWMKASDGDAEALQAAVAPKRQRLQEKIQAMDQEALQEQTTAQRLRAELTALEEGFYAGGMKGLPIRRYLAANPQLPADLEQEDRVFLTQARQNLQLLAQYASDKHEQL